MTSAPYLNHTKHTHTLSAVGAGRGFEFEPVLLMCLSSLLGRHDSLRRLVPLLSRYYYIYKRLPSEFYSVKAEARHFTSPFLLRFLWLWDSLLG